MKQFNDLVIKNPGKEMYKLMKKLYTRDIKDH
jgi:hypothetical protein